MTGIEIISSELLFWSGIILVVAAVILAAIWVVWFCFSGRKLKKKLEWEYGAQIQ